MDRLQHILQLLERPIEFASRDRGAHLSTVKNLGPFVSDKVVEALSTDVYLPIIETDLLALRQLFADFDEGLSTSERKHRLTVARQILERLRRRREPALGDANDAAVPSAPPQALWDVPIRFAKGVGPKRAALLEKLGVQTVEDALWFLPRRYEDRSALTPIGELTPGAQATICGVIRTSQLKRTARRGLAIVQVTVEDATGGLTAVYFNQPYLADVLTSGRRVMLSGLVSAGRRGWTDIRMDAPQYEVLGKEGDPQEETESEPNGETLHVGRIVPIYPETRGMTSRQIRVLQKMLLEQFLAGLEDVLPAAVRARHRLLPVQTAVAELHFPSKGSDLHLLERGVSPGHRRLAFEELFLLQVALAIRKQSVQKEIKGIQFRPHAGLLERLRTQLPFELTKAQQRVLGDIRRDMEAPHPMNRLIQGDVGCGKTVVALHAMVIACGSGYQAALMAPTEILAEQHYLNLRDLIGALGLKAVLLKSRAASKRQARQTTALEQIASGEAQVVIGTHALIQKGVRFARLGLVVIDEQHKFGVLQRKTLLEKGYHPDVLVMTATPIPRTLAMTVYGDLDMSVIDMLPPGRAPIRTRLLDDSQRRRAYQLLQEQVRRGRQGYIVYPLVGESEKVDLRAAMQAAERFQREFRFARVGLLHGRMKSDEKERVMAAFKAGEIQILVSTTVIEVGVDVPNATVMLIEHAERFGLAQLHQLRGRIGRGSLESFCFLLASWKMTPSEGASPAQQRLQALVNSTDGFAIAEEDLSIRGPGEFFGVRQWGLPELRVADLIRDAALLQEARGEAFSLLASDPGLTVPAHRPLREAMLRRWEAKLELAGIG
jgi:ATP-dependent DNA helicase RecG